MGLLESILVNQINPIDSLREESNWLKEHFYEEIENYNDEFYLGNYKISLPLFIIENLNDWKFCLQYQKFYKNDHYYNFIDEFKSIEEIKKKLNNKNNLYFCRKIRLSGYKFQDTTQICIDCEKKQEKIDNLKKLLEEIDLE